MDQQFAPCEHRCLERSVDGIGKVDMGSDAERLGYAAHRSAGTVLRSCEHKVDRSAAAPEEGKGPHELFDSLDLVNASQEKDE